MVEFSQQFDNFWLCFVLSTFFIFRFRFEWQCENEPLLGCRKVKGYGKIMKKFSGVDEENVVNAYNTFKRRLRLEIYTHKCAIFIRLVLYVIKVDTI